MPITATSFLARCSICNDPHSCYSMGCYTLPTGLMVISIPTMAGSLLMKPHLSSSAASFALHLEVPRVVSGKLAKDPWGMLAEESTSAAEMETRMLQLWEDRTL